MATFELQGPDGGTYQVDAPDAASAFTALHGAQPEQPPAQLSTFGTVTRAIETGVPFVDRAIAGAKTYLPEGYGGTGQDYATNLATERQKNTAFEQQNPWTAGVGKVAAMAPLAALAPEAGIIGNAGIGAGIGALEGASGTPDLTDIGQTAGRAGIGAGLGGIAGAAVPAVAGAARRAITPFTIPPERQALVDALSSARVPASAGQTVGSRGLQELEGAGFAADQGKAFTGGLMERGGILAANSTQPEIASAKKSIVDKFDFLASRNTLVPDEQLAKDLSGAPGDFNKLIAPSPEVANVADRLAARTSQPISGPEYASLRSELGDRAYALHETNPVDAQAYRNMRNALDSAMDRSVAANNPADAGAFKEVRRAYGNFQDILEAAKNPTAADAAAGTISPKTMQNVLARGSGGRDYAAGEGDLAGLTRAGVGIATPPPGQGGLNPFSRHALLHALGRAGAGPLVRMPAVQAYLKNQALPGAGPDASKLSALAAALAGDAATR